MRGKKTADGGGVLERGDIAGGAAARLTSSLTASTFSVGSDAKALLASSTSSSWSTAPAPTSTHRGAV